MIYPPPARDDTGHRVALLTLVSIIAICAVVTALATAYMAYVVAAFVHALAQIQGGR